jgi:two-component system, OmpR family, phosphate regulon sensor histidine kinase PhoR
MKLRLALRFGGVIGSLLLMLTGAWIGVFFLTSLLYGAIGSAPPAFLVQAINSLLGLLLVGGFVTLVNILISLRSGTGIRRLEEFSPIVVALEQIAKGDFRVRLKSPSETNLIARELANSVNQMAQELDQMELLRQEFISNVSHDIQSPLTSIRGFARALHDEHLSDESRNHYLTIIETESTRLSRMTDNMLKMVTLEAEHVKVVCRPYRLDKQIRSLILACEPQWAGKAIDMDLELPETVISADEDLLGQVWGNLLHNSIKFTPAGGQVHVELQQQNRRVICRVTDTGIGISEKALEHVFERFYKADQARERANAGSGLGLAITKKIVDLHRGTITIASKPGTGTAVTVSLPE